MSNDGNKGPGGGATGSESSAWFSGSYGGSGNTAYSSYQEQPSGGTSVYQGYTPQPPQWGTYPGAATSPQAYNNIYTPAYVSV